MQYMQYPTRLDRILGPVRVGKVSILTLLPFILGRIVVHVILYNVMQVFYTAMENELINNKELSPFKAMVMLDLRCVTISTYNYYKLLSVCCTGKGTIILITF